MMETTTIVLVGGIVALFGATGYYLVGKRKKEQQSNLEDDLKPEEPQWVKNNLMVNDGTKKEYDKRPAKIVFVENLNAFAPLLKGVEKGNVDKNAWTETIIGLYNEELIGIWKKVINRPEILIKIIASWGVSYDACREFEYMKGREDMYSCEDGSPLEIGNTYKVISPCWIYTDTNGQKSVIVKGSVTQRL